MLRMAKKCIALLEKNANIRNLIEKITSNFFSSTLTVSLAFFQGSRRNKFNIKFLNKIFCHRNIIYIKYHSVFVEIWTINHIFVNYYDLKWTILVYNYMFGFKNWYSSSEWISLDFIVLLMFSNVAAYTWDHQFYNSIYSFKKKNPSLSHSGFWSKKINYCF